MSQFNDGVPTEGDFATGTAWCWGDGRPVLDTSVERQTEQCYAELDEQISADARQEVEDYLTESVDQQLAAMLAGSGLESAA